MASVSGLSFPHRVKARSLACRAAKLGVRNEPLVHYTQNLGLRWQGIALSLKAYKGRYPRFADCSSFVGWCLWNGLSHYTKRDTVFGTGWTHGNTTFQRAHGKRVKHRLNWRRGDLIHYGEGGSAHVAILIAPIRGLVVSHGSEGGPMVLKWNYRPDYRETRRHI